MFWDTTEVLNTVDASLKITNDQVGRGQEKLKSVDAEFALMRRRFCDLEDRVATLEEANVEKEGRINALEESLEVQTALVKSMETRLCHCGETKVTEAPGLAGVVVT